MALFNILKLISQKAPPTCSVVIAAAGSSQRCKGEDKLFFIINEKPVLAYSIEAFQTCAFVDEIIVMTRQSQLEKVSQMCREYNFNKVTKVLVGGQTRTHSVFEGVFAVSAKSKLIAIHDGARACIDRQIIERTLDSAAKFHAAAPAVQIVSTLKQVTGEIIDKTVDRSNLVEIQTPQIFRSEIIKAALTNVMKKSIEVTDECTAVEIIGLPVHVVKGSRSNIKITDKEDLEQAEMIISKRGNK